MSSQRRGRKGRRSQSPPADRDRRDSHSSYRQRDDYDRRDRDYYDHHGRNDGFRPRDHDSRNNSGYDYGNHRQYDSQPQGVPNFTGQNPNVTINNHFGPAPTGNYPAGNAQMGGRGGRGGDRGPSQHRRESSQHSRPPRDSMPPPVSKAPLSSKRSKNKREPSREKPDRPPRRAEPKKIPGKLRDKCGACEEGHDIRYCPYPNTEDGRTKICPVCDTSKHAWFQCKHYDEKNTLLKFDVCWRNRQGLPIMVHNESLHDIFMDKVDLGDDKTSVEARFSVLNTKAGPLSPAFVERLMSAKDRDDDVQRQLRDGQRLPWDLEREVLESNIDRPDHVIEDPATKNMQSGNRIRDTRTTHVPIAGKLKYFISLDRKYEATDQKYAETAQLNSSVYEQMRGLNLGSSTMTSRRIPTTVRRTLPSGKWAKRNDDQMAVTCGNCGTEAHKTQACPIPCKQCGESMEYHTCVNGQCNQGCLCRDNPGHKRPGCDRPCRPCLLMDRDSITQLKDCKTHCQFHLCLTADNRDHNRCVVNHEDCPRCHGRHWHQDCPQWLATICPVSSCRKASCEDHCAMCGGLHGQKLADNCSQECQPDPTMWFGRLSDLASRWHEYLHDNQWNRVDVPDGDIRKDAWSNLQCRTHDAFVVDAGSLEELRKTAWKSAISHIQQGYEEGSLSKAAAVLAVPECTKCFAQAYTPGSGDFQDRQPGTLTEWGGKLLAGFFPASKGVP